MEIVMKNVIKLMGLMILSMANMQAAGAGAPEPIVAAAVNPFVELTAQVKTIMTKIGDDYREDQFHALLSPESLDALVDAYKPCCRKWQLGMVAMGPSLILSHDDQIPHHIVMVKRRLRILCIRQIESLQRSIQLAISQLNIPGDGANGWWRRSEIVVIKCNAAIDHLKAARLDDNETAIDFGVSPHPY